MLHSYTSIHMQTDVSKCMQSIRMHANACSCMTYPQAQAREAASGCHPRRRRRRRKQKQAHPHPSNRLRPHPRAPPMAAPLPPPSLPLGAVASPRVPPPPHAQLQRVVCRVASALRSADDDERCGNSCRGHQDSWTCSLCNHKVGGASLRLVSVCPYKCMQTHTKCMSLSCRRFVCCRVCLHSLLTLHLQTCLLLLFKCVQLMCAICVRLHASHMCHRGECQLLRAAASVQPLRHTVCNRRNSGASNNSTHVCARSPCTCVYARWCAAVRMMK
jgi:hypothetical protein